MAQFSGNFTGTVNPAPPTTITVTAAPAADPIAVGGQTQIVAHFNPAAPAGSTASFSLVDNGEASIQTSGVISADGLTATTTLNGLAPGTYTGTCTLNTP